MFNPLGFFASDQSLTNRCHLRPGPGRPASKFKPASDWNFH
jgi:hypothetical protein